MKENTSEYNAALAAKADRWVPACGGHEVPFTYNGTRYLYCYNPGQQQHAYLNLDTDMIEPFPEFVN